MANEDHIDGLDASHGVDLLGLALGRGAGPGATDLDEFVEFQLFYDGTSAAVQVGEAEPFLRAKVCEVFELLWEDLGKYLWHRDRFCLEIDMGTPPGAKGVEPIEPHLVAHLRTGDGAEDEWFVVHLLRRLSSLRPDLACRVVDADGEPILIEAALAAPRWLTPDSAENRVWLRGGKVHLLPKPRPPEPMRLPRHEGLKRLRTAEEGTAAKEKVQAAIASRLAGYPRSAIDLSRHVARAVLPKPVARVLLAFPQLVAVALDHLPPPPAAELQRHRQRLPQQEAQVHLDCEGQNIETVCVGIRFTRCQYARTLGLKFQLPQRFTAKHWKQPPGTAAPEAAMQLGALLCAGLEVAFLQDTTSATAVLRWPSAEAEKAVLPSDVPWSADGVFLKHASTSTLRSSPARRAFLQQSQLDESFRTALRSAMDDPALTDAVDLAVHWRDRNDAEDWLEVSSEELDRDMQARQAEFEAFDLRRASSKAGRNGAEPSKAGPTPAATAENPSPEDVQKEIAALGKQLSGLLGNASGLEGVDALKGLFGAKSGGDAAASAAKSGDEEDSDEESGSELDVLGMEEEPEDDSEEEEGEDRDGAAGEGSLHEYMEELDEQLEGAMDDRLPTGEAGAAAPTANGMQLGSKHVKVHGTGPVELDVHAMEHVLASFCAEHSLSPGPASLLLGELGLGGGSLGARRSAADAPCAADDLDAMD